jgi:Fe-S cluster biogenesis protein NfuA
MFIQTEATNDAGVMAFLPGREVLPSGQADFGTAEAAVRSPLAAEIFAADPAVARVVLLADRIVVTKAESADWQAVKPAILSAIMVHYMTDQPVLNSGPGNDDSHSADSEEVDSDTLEIINEITELIETRVTPAVAQAGGEVSFESYKSGVVYLRMSGAAMSLKGPIENMLRHYVPEVLAVRDHLDAGPKPGLDTAEARAIQELLDQRINPSVAMHGGHIALIDVKDDIAYIRMEGGCQGCGMASVTLKQGVETAIKEAVPSITQVLDSTDHAEGENPYFQPSKGGAASPFG